MCGRFGNFIGGAAETEDNEVTIAFEFGNPDKYGLSEQGMANADCCDTGDGVLPSDALAIQRLDAKIIEKLPDITK